MDVPTWEDSEPIESSAPAPANQQTEIPKWEDSEPMPTSWSDVPANALQEIKDIGKAGMNLYEAGTKEGGLKEMFTNPETNPAWQMIPHPTVNEQTGEISMAPGAIVNQLKDIATNPIEEFKKHPIGTLGVVAPVLSEAHKGIGLLGGASKAAEAGKLAEVGEAAKVAEAGEIPGYGGKLANRLKSNITAGTLDLGTYGVRKLARALNMNPESAVTHINSELNELMPGWLDATDTAASKFQKFENANTQASKFIGDVIDQTTTKMGEAPKLPEIDEAIGELKGAADKYKGMASASNLEAKNELLDTATRFEQLKESGELNFRNIYEVKKGIGEKYHSPIDNPGVDRAYGIVSDKIDKILDRVHLDDPALKEQFNQSKRLFKLTSELMPAMTRGVAREVSGVGGGLTNAGLGVAAVMGHPIAASGAFLGKTLPKILAPDLGKNLIYKGMNAAKNIPNMIPSGANINRAALAAFLARNEANKKKPLTPEMENFVNSKLNRP